ncbi:MAG: zinc ABC transporter substrate-binding protein [Oscillospiraceae bacterium]|nr:zinc ABC transporter substrate-binding protein [Oscillospiraceae bacterium]
MKLQKLLAAAAAGMLLLTGCAPQQDAPEADKLRIVCTIFPEYDWMRELTKDVPDVELTCLAGNGSDLHSYQPTADDIVKIADCDIFVYVGGESDTWVDDALAGTHRDSRQVIAVLDALGGDVLEEETVEGMQAEEEEEEEGEEEAPEYDEHFWLSPRCAVQTTALFESALASADPAHADLYRQNRQTYTEALTGLDEAFCGLAEAHPGAVLLFADRFPFRYLTDELGFSYYAAFSGCSAETEASFETIAFLAEKTDELGLPFVCTIEGSDCSIADAVIRSTKTQDQKIITLNSLQSVTAQELSGGMTYLDVMQQNYETLKEALES